MNRLHNDLLMLRWRFDMISPHLIRKQQNQDLESSPGPFRNVDGSDGSFGLIMICPALRISTFSGIRRPTDVRTHKASRTANHESLETMFDDKCRERISACKP